MSAYVPAELRRQIREQFHGCCAYCHTNETLTVVTFEIEHIVPWSAGGLTALPNLCFACPQCNRHKARRQEGLDPASTRTVPLFHPQQQAWQARFSWIQEASLLQGLTSQGRATIEALKMNRPQIVRVRRLWVKLGEHPPNFVP